MIYLDIETIQQDPYPWMIKPASALKAPKNYKDPEKIAAWVQEMADAQNTDLRERSSLEPILGGIVAVVGVAVDEAEPKALVNASGDEEGERRLLTTLQAGLARYPDHPIVSWNGAFDWSYLAKRAMRHGLWDLARRLHVAKPWGDRLHVDPGIAWQGSQRDALWRLPAVAQYLGIETIDDIDGSQVTAQWAAGDEGRARVVAHCLSDVRILREVTARLVAAGWVPAEVPEQDLPIPPPRGSVGDLLLAAVRLQRDRRPDQILTAWETAAQWVPQLEKGQTWAPVDGPMTSPGGPPRWALDVPETERTPQILRAYVDALRGAP